MTAHVLISPQTWDRVRAAYAAGSTAEDLIAACGVSRSQVYARARDEGWRLADRPVGSVQAHAGVAPAPAPPPVPEPDQTHTTHSIAQSAPPRSPGKRARRRARGRGGV